MLMQLDIFGAPAVPVDPETGVMRPTAPPKMNVAAPAARGAVPPLPLPRRTAEWEALLASSEAAADIVVFCSTLWTGVVLEVLSCPKHGRKHLDATGVVGEYPPDTAFGRIVYANPGMLRAWHWKRSLKAIGAAGTHGARFRFTEAAGSDRLILPYPLQEKAPAQ